MKKVFLSFLLIFLFLLSGCDEVPNSKKYLSCVNGHIYIYKTEGISLIYPIYDENQQLIQCKKVKDAFEYDKSKVNQDWGNLGIE